MSKLTPRDSTKRTLRDRLASPQWQYWIARVVPMLYVTILSIMLPKLLPQSWSGSELAATQEQELQQQLRSISIKVLAHGKTIGSGVLLNRQQQVYTVITTARVIQAASAPYKLQTHDGQVYPAALIRPPLGQNRDLSILRFYSHQRIYTTAKLASATPNIGDRFWSCGFLLDLPGATSNAAWEPNIISGQITQTLPIAISGGYSIGLDSTMSQGMSGGPTIDRSGELVGINGLRFSRSDRPEILEDGSIVSDVLQEQINNSSWAIPIEFIKEYSGGW
jgi:S1-C subfamily serine protease